MARNSHPVTSSDSTIGIWGINASRAACTTFDYLTTLTGDGTWQY